MMVCCSGDGVGSKGGGAGGDDDDDDDDMRSPTDTDTFPAMQFFLFSTW